MNHDIISIDTGDGDAGAVTSGLASWLGGHFAADPLGSTVRISDARLDVIRETGTPCVMVSVDDDDPDEHRAMERIVEAILAHTDWGVETVTAEDVETVVRSRKATASA